MRAQSAQQETPLVLHVIHHLHMGGMENGVVNLINTLPGSEFRHAIACVEDYSDFRNRIGRPDVNVTALQRSRIGVWRMRRQIYRLCRTLRPAILHTRNQSGLDALLPARFAGVRRIVHGEHGWDVDNLCGEKWKPALLRRMHAPFVDRYITVSRDLERYLVRRIGIAAQRITQIYNGVDTNRFAPANGKPPRVLPQNFEGKNITVVGTVGRLQPVKDQATLIRAIALAVRRRKALRSRLRLAVIGDGPLHEQLRELLVSEGIEDIAWLPGSIDQIPDLLRALDVFVLPSLNEGISNTVLEAMASRLPVLATAVGGNAEVVDDGRTGHLFPPHDVETLSRMIEEYVDQPALREAHAAESRRRAVESFDLSLMVERYRAVYTTMLTTPGM
jgi:sugar transferase (PEP-CTERM/EpsH1 system associated)